MGFFSFLFGKPVFIVDKVFGRLQRESVDKHTGKAWFVTEELFFAPTSQTIGCYIDAPAEGPTQAQRDFYQYIEQQYAELTPKLIPLIEDEFRSWKPHFAIGNFEAEFQLTGISIPTMEIITPVIEWNWSFDTIHDANHMLTIYMHGDTPMPGVQFDG